MRLMKVRMDQTLSAIGKVRLTLVFTTGVILLLAATLPFAAASSDELLKPGPIELPEPGEVILQFPAPGQNPCGLAWDGSHLWVADDDTDTIYKLDPSDGAVLSSFGAPGTQPRGLAWDGTHLLHQDNSTRDLYKLDRVDGAVQSTVGALAKFAVGTVPEFSGMTWDGQHVWYGTVNGWSSMMNAMDPADGSEAGAFFTKGYPRALATGGAFIWSATNNEGHRLGIVYKYNRSNGLYVSQFDTPGFYPTGLAYDGQYLWCVDRVTKTIYKLAAN